MHSKIKEKLSRLPEQPGVYRFKDSNGELLYIGKAKNLNHRVKSYFVKSTDLSPAKQQMLAKINKIEYTVVQNETEAFLLESTLIKKHQSPYNVDLKDDKFWLYLKLSVEKGLPKISASRKILNDKARYFGPYTSASAVHYTIKLLKRIFPYLANNREFKQYRLIKHQEILNDNSSEQFKETFSGIIKFLGGQTEKVEKDLQNKMAAAAKAKRFEKAALLRDQLEAVRRIKEKQKVIYTKNVSQDIVNIYLADYNQASITILKIREGKLIDQQNFLIARPPLLSGQDLLEEFINRYYFQTQSLPKNLILPFALRGYYDLPGEIKKITVPAKGDKKKLLQMALENARQFYQFQQPGRPKNALIEALIEIKKLFNLARLPERIEGYDISNIQGELPVASMVVFTQGKSDKKNYRLFSIKTISQANDPAMIGEALSRRAGHAEWQTPDLILIDGGPTQLKAASDAWPSVPMIGLAKKNEEIHLSGSTQADGTAPAQIIRLSQRSTALQLLQRVRDEAHRFAKKAYKRKHSHFLVEA